MGGSSGGGAGGESLYGRLRSEDLRSKLRQDTEERNAEFKPVLQRILDNLLSNANSRDTELVDMRIEEILSSLSETLDSSVNLRFGGSVAKHTYVDGISDIDLLLVVRSELADIELPSQLLNLISRELSKKVQDGKIRKGQIAITVQYNDGMEIQLIPAVKENRKTLVPAWKEDTWSKIDPKKFTDALTKRNKECGGKLIPTIKLAKAINSTLSKPHQLSGYHLESLAISVFRDYAGTRTTSHMLPYFFDGVSKRIQWPMTDSTGQSVHVDSDLGRAHSEKRKILKHVFERIAKRMRNASAAKSKARWLAMFNED